MKHSRRCPKCDGVRLWKIEGLAAKDPSVQLGGSLPVRLAVGRRTAPTKERSFFSGDGSSLYDAGSIDAFVCDGCGYTELWSRDLSKLTHNPASGVFLLEG